MPKLKDETIGGVTVEIHITPGGEFRVLAPGDALIATGDTLDQAIQRARPKIAQKKVKAAVRFVTKAGEHGEATGIHVRNRSVLARVDGETVQLDSHQEVQVFRADIPQETLDRYLTLGVEIRERQREQKTITSEFEFDLRKAVRAEIARMSTELAATDAE